MLAEDVKLSFINFTNPIFTVDENDKISASLGLLAEPAFSTPVGSFAFQFRGLFTSADDGVFFEIVL